MDGHSSYSFSNRSQEPYVLLESNGPGTKSAIRKMEIGKSESRTRCQRREMRRDETIEKEEEEEIREECQQNIKQLKREQH